MVGFATAALVVVAALLMLQPNLGDTILFAGIWFVLVLLVCAIYGNEVWIIALVAAGGLAAALSTAARASRPGARPKASFR